MDCHKNNVQCKFFSNYIQDWYTILFMSFSHYLHSLHQKQVKNLVVL